MVLQIIFKTLVGIVKKHTIQDRTPPTSLYSSHELKLPLTTLRPEMQLLIVRVAYYCCISNPAQ
jgi:hypothetical protein